LNRSDFNLVEKTVKAAIGQGLFSGAALSAGVIGESVFKGYWGRKTFVPWSQEIEKSSFFDLASLTKPMITALAYMVLVEKGRISLKERLSKFFDRVPADKDGISVHLLLCHAAGLASHNKFYDRGPSSLPRQYEKRIDAVCNIILSMPLVCPPATKAIYSDLGYILLGRIIEKITGYRLFDFVQNQIFSPFVFKGFGWPGSPGFSPELSVPTGYCPVRKRMLMGEVNDTNAWFLGGEAGHAGLFGTLEAVDRLLLMLAGAFLGEGNAFPVSHKTIRPFFLPDGIPPGSTWMLGFDSPSGQGSTAGKFFSKISIGHLGYTGTSFWIDLDAGIYVIFLSNRTLPFDTPESRRRMKSFRQTLHNTVRRCLDART